jgi:hypothetical protein
MRVVTVAKGAARGTWRTRRLSTLVTIDVKNAFNSLPWETIAAALWRKNLPGYLTNLLVAFLGGRKGTYESATGRGEFSIEAGVPQGSVLGPALWNIAYDGLLRLEMPDGVQLVGFADDVGVLGVAKTEDALVNQVNGALGSIATWMQEAGLQIAPQKTEAVVFSGRRKLDPIVFQLQGHTVEPSTAIKYLGVWLDKSLTFGRHITEAARKAEVAEKNIARLLPRVKGPTTERRLLLQKVVESRALYGAPIWAEATKVQKFARCLLTIQRRISIRTVCGYKTLALETALLLASARPIDLEAQRRRKTYLAKKGDRLIPPEDATEELYTAWQSRWETYTGGTWTKQLIPNVRPWAEREHGSLNYELTQILTGHGCFASYRKRIGKAPEAICQECSTGEEDGPEHVLMKCAAHHEERSDLREALGTEITPRQVGEALLQSEGKWACVSEFAKRCMIKRAIAEREREREREE